MNTEGAKNVASFLFREVTKMVGCVFCEQDGGKVLYRNELFRIILVDDQNYPGYLRVILNQHLKELTDLDDSENLAVYQAVISCEQLLRQYLQPEKINLASFGNMTPHVHWHIIPRFSGDRHFPNPTWGEVTNPDYQPSDQLKLKVVELVDNFNKIFKND